MNRPRRTSRILLLTLVGGFLALLILGALAVPAHAGPKPSRVAEGGTDQIAEIIGEVAISVVRLLIGAGAAVFVVGVARGAFDGVLASAFGKPGAVSTGLMRTVGIVGTFLLLLVSFGFSRAIVDLLLARFVDQGALTTPIPGQVEVYVPKGAGELEALAGVNGEALRLILFMIGAWFMLSMLVAIINGEIGMATGAPGAMARLVERSVTSLVLLLIGATAPALARQFAVAVEGAGVITNAGQAVQLYGVVFTIVFDILLAVLVAVFIVSVVSSAFVGQAGAVLGLPYGLGSGIVRVVAAAAIALLGFGMISMANHMIVLLLS